MNGVERWKIQCLELQVANDMLYFRIKKTRCAPKISLCAPKSFHLGAHVLLGGNLSVEPWLLLTRPHTCTSFHTHTLPHTLSQTYSHKQALTHTLPHTHTHTHTHTH